MSPSKAHRNTEPVVYPVDQMPVGLVFPDARHTAWVDARRALLESGEPCEIRFWCEHLAQHGMKNPLIVHRRPNGYEVEIGSQRLLCAQFMGWETVPVIIVPDGADIATVKEHNYTDVGIQPPRELREMPSRHHRTLAQAPLIPPEESGGGSREEEIAKYRRLYTEFPKYKTGLARLSRFVDWARHRGISSLLDIGSGRGEIVQAARRSPVNILKVQGYEVVPELCGVSCADPGSPEKGHLEVRLFDGMHDIPEESDSWDWVTCCDVLEHVTEDDAKAGIAEMIRVAKTGLYLTISWAADGWGRSLGQGEILHITRRPLEWWMVEIERACPKAHVYVLRSGPENADLEVTLDKEASSDA